MTNNATASTDNLAKINGDWAMFAVTAWLDTTAPDFRSSTDALLDSFLDWAGHDDRGTDAGRRKLYTTIASAAGALTAVWVD